MKNSDEIIHIAELSKLDPYEEGFSRLASDFENIVSMIDKLKALDVSEIKDELDIGHINALRDDEPVLNFTREELLKNAPASEAGCIAVPSVME